MLEPVADCWLKADSFGVNQMEGAIRLVQIVNEIVKMHALLHFSFCPEETSMPALEQRFRLALRPPQDFYYQQLTIREEQFSYSNRY